MSNVLFRISTTCKYCNFHYKFEVTETEKKDTCPKCNNKPEEKQFTGCPSLGYNYKTKGLSNNMKDRLKEMAKNFEGSAKDNLLKHV